MIIRKFVRDVIADFSGGVNKKNTVLTLAKNEVIDAINLNLTQEGGLEKRGGYTKLIDGSTDYPILSLYCRKFSDSDTEDTVIGIKKNASGTYDIVYVKPDLTSLPASWTTLSSGAFTDEVWFAQFFDVVYIGNGVDDNKKIMPDKSVYGVGLDAPSTAPTATASATSASLYGTYKYKVTFLRQDTPIVESNPSPEVEITVDGTAVDLSNIPTSPDPQVNARAIYRTTADGGTFYLLDIINDNTTTTYTDTTVDEGLSATLLEETRDKFPKAKYLKALAGRLWGINEDGDLVYSNFLRPDEWDSLNVLKFPEAKGQITGLAVLGNLLVVFKDNAIYLVNPQYDDTPAKIMFSSQIGCNFPHSIVEVGDAVYFANYDGVYKLTERGMEYISLKIEPFWRETLDFSSYQPRAIYYPLKHQYIISGTDGSKNYWLVFDTYKKAWTIYEIVNPLAFHIFTHNTSEEKPIFAYNGKVYLFDYGWTDDGTEFTSTLTTRYFLLGAPGDRARIRRVYPLVYSEGDLTGTVAIGADFIMRKPHTFTLIPAAIWGNVTWGNFIWGFEGINNVRVDTNERGSAFSFQVKIGGSSYFNIIGIGYAYQRRGYEKPYLSH